MRLVESGVLHPGNLGREGPFFGGVIDASKALHLGIKIIQRMQHIGFGGRRNLRGTVFRFAVVSEDHMGQDIEPFAVDAFLLAFFVDHHRP
jgi:hypothetical protein